MEPVIILPSGVHTHTIIFLHGRDSLAKEFAPELFESQATDLKTLPKIFQAAKWVFPTAEIIKSKRFDCEMSQWFDMHTTEDPHEQEDDQDLTPAISRIQEIIAKEAATIGHQNVILGGISQGCAVAIHALLSGQRQVGGFIGLCSWLPKKEAIKRLDRSANQAIKTPVLLCHAQDDDVINISFGREMRDDLAGVGMEVRWREYEDGGHWVNEPKGVDDIVAFLRDMGTPE